MGLSLFENLKQSRVVTGGLGSGGSGDSDLELVASDTSEYTTTSTSSTDLVTLGGLSIATTTPIVMYFSYRKTSGTQEAAFGLKINSTITAECDLIFGIARILDAVDETGMCRIFIAPRSTNYLRSGSSEFNLVKTDGTKRLFNNAAIARTAAIPNVTITSITIRGLTQDAGTGLAIKNIFIYVRET